MKTLVLAIVVTALLTGFTSCQKRPNVPEKVTVVVERYRDLPTWATEQHPIPHAVDGTVGARVKSEHDRGVWLEVLYCHRRLLTLLDKGEVVDKRECDSK